MDWRYNTIWFEQIETGNFLKQDFKVNPIIKQELTEVEYAILRHLKRGKSSFDNLVASTKLKYLELNWANIEHFEGIRKYDNLKRLELHYCIKLQNDSGINQVSESLQHLHINQSKKFIFSDNILKLTNLRVLCLNSCGPIDNLSFLKYFPKLIDFRFVNTNILDGNLTPIIEHPTIRRVGFLNKRHYNLKDVQLKNELLLKGNLDYRHIAYKGEFQTFRYDY